MKASIRKKVASCKALAGKGIMDVLEMPEFLSNLSAYWDAQREDRSSVRLSYEAMRRVGDLKGYKVPAHVIDRLAPLSAEELASEFASVIVGQCDRPFAERNYIRQIGIQAYQLTVAQVVSAEFPELEADLIPKSEN